MNLKKIIQEEIDDFDWTEDVEASWYREKIEHFQQRFSKKVLDVVKLDERNWPYDLEGSYRENYIDVNVDGEWIICKL